MLVFFCWFQKGDDQRPRARGSCDLTALVEVISDDQWLRGNDEFLSINNMNRKITGLVVD